MKSQQLDEIKGQIDKFSEELEQNLVYLTFCFTHLEFRKWWLEGTVCLLVNCKGIKIGVQLKWLEIGDWVVVGLAAGALVFEWMSTAKLPQSYSGNKEVPGMAGCKEWLV